MAFTNDFRIRFEAGKADAGLVEVYDVWITIHVKAEDMGVAVEAGEAHIRHLVTPKFAETLTMVLVERDEVDD